MIALDRAVSLAIGGSELAPLARTPIDSVIAARQHDLYRYALETLGSMAPSS